MATIHKRKSKDGTRILGWKAVIRIKGYPTVCEVFDRKQEAEDWAQDVERKIKMGQYNFDRLKALHTFDALVDRFINSGALEHHKAAEGTLRRLEYWKIRFKSYALVHLTPEFIAKERQFLLQTPTEKGKIRSPSTANRYIAALSSLFTFACKELRLQAPKHKRYKTDDSTVEKLGELLIDNPQGLLLFRDELSGWLRSFEKSGRENDRPFFLQSWSRKEDFDVDRIGRGSLHVPSLYLSGINPTWPLIGIRP